MAPLGAQALPRGVGISLGRCELDARVDLARPAAAVCPNPAGAALPVATDAPVGLAMRRRPLSTPGSPCIVSPIETLGERCSKIFSATFGSRTKVM